MRLGGTKGRCTARRELLEPGDLNVVPNSFSGHFTEPRDRDGIKRVRGSNSSAVALAFPLKRFAAKVEASTARLAPPRLAPHCI
jgi:hypothetical protein